MKAKKLIAVFSLSVVFIILAFLGVFSVNFKKANATSQIAKDYYKGIDMSNANGYRLEKGFEQSPKTLEAVVWITGATNGLDYGECGVVIGSLWEESGEGQFALMISKDRNPILWWNKGEFSWQVNYALPTYSWVHMVFVRDATANKIYFYVNGNLTDTKDGIGAEIATPSANHWIGRDARYDGWGGKSNLMGSLNYVGLSSQVVSAEQVKTAFYNYKRVITTYDTNPILSEDLSQNVRAYYRSYKKLEKTPLTITATVKTTASEAGSILSTYCHANGYNVVNLEMTWDGYVKLRWDPKMNNGTEATSVIFNDNVSLKINTGNKTHIAVVKDTDNFAFKLFLNGVLVCTKSIGSTPSWFAWENVPTLNVAIGRDLNVDADWKQMRFNGEIYDLAVYSVALTDNQLSYENSITDKTTIDKTTKFSNSETGLMANWVLSDKQSKLVYYENYLDPVVDYSGNQNNAKVCTMAHYILPETDWFKADKDEYTLVYLPDTQIVVRSSPHYIDGIFNWMVDNKESMNLQFVMGLGDITDGKPLAGDTSMPGINVDLQWDKMQENYDKLTNAGIYWSAVVGNHDYDDNGLSAENGRKANIFNEHFGYETLTENEKKTIISRYDNNSMLNVIYEYSVTTKSGLEANYLLVAVEFGPSDEVLSWASNVISQEKYKNHRVLFNTHSLIYHNGEFAGTDTIYDPEFYPWVSNTSLNFNNGRQIYAEFLSQHKNTFMAASGHIGTDSVETRLDTGVNGNKIFSFLCDGQGTKVYADYDGDSGWGEPVILVVKVNEKTKTLKFNYYDPLNNMMLGVENQFEVDFSDWGNEQSSSSSSSSSQITSSSSSNLSSASFSEKESSSFSESKNSSSSKQETVSSSLLSSNSLGANSSSSKTESSSSRQTSYSSQNISSSKINTSQSVAPNKKGGCGGNIGFALPCLSLLFIAVVIRFNKKINNR